MSMYEAIVIMGLLVGLFGFILCFWVLQFKKEEIRNIGLATFPERFQLTFYTIPIQWIGTVANVCTWQALGLHKNKKIYQAYKDNLSGFWVGLLILHCIFEFMFAAGMFYGLVTVIIPENINKGFSWSGFNYQSTMITLGNMVILWGAYRSWKAVQQIKKTQGQSPQGRKKRKHQKANQGERYDKKKKS